MAQIRRLLAASALLAAPLLPAQAARVIPDGLGLATTEGNYNYHFPFNPTVGRMTNIYHKSVMGPAMMIAGFRIRPDGLFTTYRPWPAQPVTNLSIWIGNHPGPQYSDRYSFSGNRIGDYTQVIKDTTLNLPLTPLPMATPEPFTAGPDLKFSKPFLYDGKAGLLIEYLRAEPVYQYNRWYVDSYLQMKYVDPPIGTGALPSPYGTQANLGTGCPTSFYDDIDNAYPGSIIRTLGKVFGAQLPMLGTIGLSNASFMGLGLPLDLGPFGATGCTLRNDWLLTNFTVSLNVPDGDYEMAWGYVPADPSFTGLKLYGQALALDPPYNALGLRVSRAWSLVLGTGFPADMVGVTYHIEGAGTDKSDRPGSWYPRCNILELY